MQKINDYKRITLLSIVMVLSCHISAAYGCAEKTVDNVRFTSATSFAAGDEQFRLADVVKVDETAQAFAQKWTQNKRVKLQPLWKAEPDRYGRCAVYVLDATNDYSLQYAYVAEGLAIGYNEKWSKLSNTLMKAEAQARQSKKGLWSSDDIVIDAHHTPEDIGRFVIVEGVVKNIYNHKKGHVMLNFGEEWKTDFTVFIPNFSAKRFKKGYLKGLIGKKIESRGILYSKNGPSISILNQNYLKILEK